MYIPTNDNMSAVDPRTKTCGRCNHVWNSYSNKPVRCPSCGTYHWEEKPTTNVCIVCGHRWFSRTIHSPIRCPRCKTRSWHDGEVISATGRVKKPAYSFDTGDVTDRYEQGKGCVAIAMETGLSIDRVISIISSELEETHLRM